MRGLNNGVQTERSLQRAAQTLEREREAAPGNKQGKRLTATAPAVRPEAAASRPAPVDNTKKCLLAPMPIGGVLGPFWPVRAKGGSNITLGPTVPIRTSVTASWCTRQHLASLPPQGGAPLGNRNARVDAGGAGHVACPSMGDLDDPMLQGRHDDKGIASPNVAFYRQQLM